MPTIGDWDETKLKRYIEQLMRDSEFLSAVNKNYEELTVTRKLTISDEIAFIQNKTTVGAAGAASAPPASPDSYARVLDANGSVRLIPLYKES